jgi:hypothetical protein
MSATKLIDLLKKLLTLHKAMVQLAVRKTDIIKNGDIETLTDHLQEEQKYILAIKQLENERALVVSEQFTQSGNNKEQTLSSYIELTDEPERTSLQELQSEFVKTILELKERNELNQQLTQQSLQFVNMSLDMMFPQDKSLNYGNPTTKQEKNQRRSMFDTQA